jgi:diaminohydroxyphosphoribosylaminopyrimidine deaminase/5-amino-6-(5-phosphoribosylamino)uracil reductase
VTRNNGASDERALAPPPLINHRDAFFMRQALHLAERGRGRTSPNPMVGALVVDEEGVIVGRGAHEYAGGPHAEVHALQDAGARARGATLYCTLEPCTHVGCTGPCAPLVADAGIGRIVIATEDPNPVAGGGLRYLRGRGLQVRCGVLGAEAARLNEAFFTRVRRGRPFVTMKTAISLDGKVSAGAGLRTALTGAAANRLVHRQRAEVDAIAVGSGTVLADDPLLIPRGAYRHRPLTRVIYDSRLRTPAAARVLSTLAFGPVIIITTPQVVETMPAHAGALQTAGATIDVAAGSAPLETSLRVLGARGIVSLLVEGGPALHRAFWDADLVDRVQIFVAPCTIGDAGLPWLREPVMSSPRVGARRALPVGDDVLLEGYVHRAD